MEDADWGGCGGVSRVGGGGDEEEEAADEACWEFTSAEEDMRTPVCGLMMGFLAPAGASGSLALWPWLPRATPCPRRPRRLLSAAARSGSEGGEGGRGEPASLSPREGGEQSSGSDAACVASDACESHDESSRLGLLDLDDSAEESCEECCDTALEPQDAALLLKRPLPLAAALLLLLLVLLLWLLCRLAAVDGAVGRRGAGGGGGGGRESI